MTKIRHQNRQNKRDKHQETGRGQVQKPKYHEERKLSIQPLQAQNTNQKRTLQAFAEKQLVLQSGSAGVGKTELMCWWASKLWLEDKIDNIIITRPHKHLGDDYGAVKGSDSEKLLPFCMSMLMKFKKYLGVGILKNNFKLDLFDEIFTEASGIMICPVEKIQGLSFGPRTIILADEMQNTTVAQIKALTTRMEEGCQLLMAGDPLQTALKGDNGLKYLEKCLKYKPHKDAEVIEYTPEDNCRKGISGHLTKVYEEQGKW